MTYRTSKGLARSFPGTGGDYHGRRTQEPVFETITAAGLSSHSLLGKFRARLVRDRFVQVWIKFLADRFDGLESILSQKIFQLL